jgi:spermidine synthase
MNPAKKILIKALAKKAQEPPSEGRSSPKSLKDLIALAKSIDLTANPGEQFITQLADSGALAKFSGHTKVAYQVKEAFAFSDETLASYKDKIGDIHVKLRDDKYIDLAFSSDDVQSRLNLDMPQRPQLAYVQTMLVAPLLLPDEKLNTILIIGFGGGTLAKYYTDFYRNKRKVLVDIRPKLFDIAQEFFNYSPDYNTTFVPSDAAKFLKRAGSRKDKYDIVNTDIFIEGPVDLQNHQYYWEDVSNVLSPHGISVSNIWRGTFEDKYQNILKFHKHTFKTVFEILNSKTDQVALYGSQMPMEMLMRSDLEIKAIEMSGLSAVNFRTHINNIRRHQ